jgi:hypothetical protein
MNRPGWQVSERLTPGLQARQPAALWWSPWRAPLGEPAEKVRLFARSQPARQSQPQQQQGHSGKAKGGCNLKFELKKP